MSEAPRPLVIDLGVWDGSDTGSYLDAGFDVLGLEPNPRAFQHAVTMNQQAIDGGHVKMVNLAVGGPAGSEEGGQRLPFYINKHQTQRSGFRNISCSFSPRHPHLLPVHKITPAHVAANCRVEMVDSIGCDALVRRFVGPGQRVQLVKMDVTERTSNPNRS